MINFKTLTNTNKVEYEEQNLKGIMVSRHPYRGVYILTGKQSVAEIKNILLELDGMAGYLLTRR